MTVIAAVVWGGPGGPSSAQGHTTWAIPSNAWAFIHLPPRQVFSGWVGASDTVSRKEDLGFVLRGTGLAEAGRQAPAVGGENSSPAASHIFHGVAAGARDPGSQ